MKPNRLSLLMLIGFIALGLNLFRMQIFKGGFYRSLSEKNRIRVIYLEGGRGEITDRTGVILAKNKLSFNCSAIAREAKPRIQESCRLLAGILGEDAEALEKRFLKRRPGMFQTVVLAEGISREQAVAIEEKLDLMPGFLIETRPQREYPLGEAAAHLTGYIGPVNDQERDLVEVFSYQSADWTGREGVEKSYESYLRGYSGGLQIEVDSRGRIVRALGVREPKEGKDLQLTVDAGLQKHVQELLQGQKGAVLVMDLSNGGLLSVNSSPAFDPNQFASKRGRRDVSHYLTSPTAPMVNRGVFGRYPPGSIFKIITAAAGLATKKVSGSTSFNCPGYSIFGGHRFGCWKEGGHGQQNMVEGFAHSCDVYFYNCGIRAGIDALHEKCVEFGQTRLTGIDLPAEKTGFVPSREWKKKKLHESWYDGDSANLAIGQGTLQMTPVGALVMVGAAATHGTIYKPHVIDKIGGVRVSGGRAKTLRIPEEHWQLIREGLSQVVNSESGTGRLARAEGVRIAGKTGTAQSGQSETHAWFVGYAPEDNPKVALVVFLENGGRGGVAAAGLASHVFRYLKDASYL